MRKRALTFPNPNPQNATGVQPSAFGGFGTHAPGTTIQSVISRWHLRRETCTNGHGKPTSMIPLIIFVFGEFSSAGISMSQMEAELKLPLVQNSQSRGSAALRHIANCPSNVRWRRVRTDGRLLDTLTEPSSLWSMSPLSSPCRMETAPGFSPWKLVIPHCGTPCLVFNFPINNFSQHLFARAGRCRG